MRSKLFALQLILRVLNGHMPFIVHPTSILYSVSNNEAAHFAQAISQHLCLSVSKNVISPVPDIFEISVEIFWRILSGMRTKLKVCGTYTLTESWLIVVIERNRGPAARNLHSYPRNEDVNIEAEGCYHGHVLETMPRSYSLGRDLLELRLRPRGGG